MITKFQAWSGGSTEIMRAAAIRISILLSGGLNFNRTYPLYMKRSVRRVIILIFLPAVRKKLNTAGTIQEKNTIPIGKVRSGG